MNPQALHVLDVGIEPTKIRLKDGWLAICRILGGATLTGLEPATSAVTGRHSDQLSYKAKLLSFSRVVIRRDSNPQPPPSNRWCSAG